MPPPPMLDIFYVIFPFVEQKQANVCYVNSFTHWKAFSFRSVLVIYLFFGAVLGMNSGPHASWANSITELQSQTFKIYYLKIFLFLWVYMCLCVVSTCMCGYLEKPGHQIPLELELRTVVWHRYWALNLTWAVCALNCWATSPLKI